MIWQSCSTLDKLYIGSQNLLSVSLSLSLSHTHTHTHTLWAVMPNTHVWHDGGHSFCGCRCGRVPVKGFLCLFWRETHLEGLREWFIHCVVYLSSCLLHTPFQLHSPHVILAKLSYSPLKIWHGKLELSTTTNSIFISKPHHHHHIALVARISLTLSRHSSLSFIALGRSSGQHPVNLEAHIFHYPRGRKR